MDSYQPFACSSLSYRERVGEPDELTSALGLITINFQELDETLPAAIASLFGTDDRKAKIVTAELSFARRLNLLAALERTSQANANSRDSRSSVDRRLPALVALCIRAGDLRNQYMHSVWPARALGGSRAVRVKRTAKAHGYRVVREDVSAALLLDVADFIAYATTMVEEFFDLPFDAAYGHSERPGTGAVP